MAMKKLAKPVMRNLLTSRLKFEAIIGASLLMIVGSIYKFGFKDPRKARYAEFYRNYDAEADFERMRKDNVFQIVDAKGKMNANF